ncbi:uncharacterized protein A4U43_C04F6540 [Asparagus officinalis]|uniref:Uncharacterized protein n=1 Tax=Asparagus officinalis TaxID=4686 RepID=A0A5P1EYS7_ASPOF|nr:uncharacterized protein A4U43_C04F6540 [Asparagus officinalis]
MDHGGRGGFWGPEELSASHLMSPRSGKPVEAEVVKLEKLKAIKMKELVLKKKTELEELRRRTHLVEKKILIERYKLLNVVRI